MQNNKFTHSELTGEILKCFFESYNRLGYGFTKSIYLEALEKALNQTKLKVRKNKTVDVMYEMDVIGQIGLDLVVADKILILVTATDQLQDKEIKRMFNFLRQSDFKIGMLLNYGERPGYKRRDLMDVPD